MPNVERLNGVQFEWFKLTLFLDAFVNRICFSLRKFVEAAEFVTQNVLLMEKICRSYQFH